MDINRRIRWCVAGTALGALFGAILGVVYIVARPFVGISTGVISSALLIGGLAGFGAVCGLVAAWASTANA